MLGAFAAPKFFREGVQGFLSNIDELFACHSSPTDTNKGTKTTWLSIFRLEGVSAQFRRPSG